MDTQNWTIEFAEKPLDLGIFDNLVYQKDTSHSFLRLVDPDGTVRSELHGLNYDPAINKKSLFSFNPVHRLIHAFKKSAEPYQPHQLKVYCFNEERTFDEALKTQTLISGSPEEILQRWIMGLERARDINEDDHEYRPFNLKRIFSAQNCHTVTMDLLKAMKFEGTVKPHYAAPGIKKALRAEGMTPDKFPRTHHDYFQGITNSAAHWSNAILEHMAPEKISHNAAGQVGSPDQDDPDIAFV